VLDALVVQSIGAFLMKKVFGVKYVKMDIKEENGTIRCPMEK
jgi:hypothetical protein